MSASSILENIARVRNNIREACSRVGRDPAGVTLIAVSKTHPPDAVFEAISAGVQHFGENRVEESSSKIPMVNASVTKAAQTSEAITWHMVGHVQSRKAKDVPPLFDVVHSVDSVKVAAKLAEAVETGKRLDIFAEVNVSGEDSKSGFDAAKWERDSAVFAALLVEMRQIVAHPSLNVRGLMTLAPIVEQMEQTRPVFASLRRLRDGLQDALGVPLPDLSMGMTDDYPIAIEEGATLVRVGRAIFGERQNIV